MQIKSVKQDNPSGSRGVIVYMKTTTSMDFTPFKWGKEVEIFKK